MDKVRFLRWYLWIFGLLNVFVISFTVPLLLGEELMWHPRNVPDEMMISVIYLAMGLVMIAATRNPLRHKAFIDFLVLANVLHGAVMIIYARNLYHLVFDGGAITAMGLLPLFFYPWGLVHFMRYGENT